MWQRYIFRPIRFDWMTTLSPRASMASRLSQTILAYFGACPNTGLIQYLSNNLRPFLYRSP